MTIKIGFYSHTIDFAGTWRSHERIVQELENDSRFKTYILYCENIKNDRLETCRRLLPNTIFVPFTRSLNKTGPEQGYTPFETNFKEVCSTLGLDILHFARTGYYEWPFNDRHATLQIETNIFGADDHSSFLDRSIAISTCVQKLKQKPSDILIPNPIPSRSANFDSVESLRKEYRFAESDIVWGRLGRSANFHPIGLIAFKETQKVVPNLKYLIVGGCEQAKAFVANNNLQGVVFVEPTNDDDWIERFHKTINVFAHYRSDGETHGTAIAQALMYDIPVVSHYAQFNAQVETIGPGGLCAQNVEEYINAIKQLSLIPESKRRSIGTKGRVYTEERSGQEKIGKLIAETYIDWLQIQRSNKH